MKRIVLFLATNLAVVLVLSVVARLLGLDAYLAVHGQSLAGLLVFAAFFGFGGAFISLAMSKWLAERALGGGVIGPSGAPPAPWAPAARKAGSSILRSRTLPPPAPAVTPRWSRSAAGSCSA